MVDWNYLCGIVKQTTPIPEFFSLGTEFGRYEPHELRTLERMFTTPFGFNHCKGFLRILQTSGFRSPVIDNYYPKYCSVIFLVLVMYKARLQDLPPLLYSTLEFDLATSHILLEIDQLIALVCRWRLMIGK